MIIKTIYCNEIAFNDLNAIYYIGKNNCLENYFSKKFIGPHYRFSDHAMSKIKSKIFCYNLLRSFFSGYATPYISLKKDDLEVDSNSDPIYHEQLKGVCFIDTPHCGDLAFCIRKANEVNSDFNKKDDLLKLLDASYEVQKLLAIYSEYLLIKDDIVTLRSEIELLITQLYYNEYNNYTEKQFDLYKNYFKDVFIHSVMCYSITIIKNLIFFLICNKVFLRQPLLFTAFFLVTCDSNIIYFCINPKLQFYHLITSLALLIGMFDENIPNNTICYYGKILCSYWVAYSSFFLIKLCFKYDAFKKNMNEYEKKLKNALIIRSQRKKLTVLL